MASADHPALIYETQLVPAMFRPLAQHLVNVAQPKPGERVLDAACGTGVVARLVAPLVAPSGSVVGLDLDPAMIAMARTLDPAIAWQEGDVQSLPFADGQFDLVTCQQGLQFLPDRDAGLREMHRVLRPGGRVVLAIWTELANSPGQALLFGALGARLGSDMSRPPPWSLTDEAEVFRLLSTAGFAGIEATVTTVRARFASGQRFVRILMEGSSKLTRQALAQLPADQRAALIEEVADRLRGYHTGAILELPMETRLIAGVRR